VGGQGHFKRFHIVSYNNNGVIGEMHGTDNGVVGLVDWPQVAIGFPTLQRRWDPAADGVLTLKS